MWLGFLVGWFLVCFSQNETSFRFQPVAALWFILIPLVDALSTFFNRIWQKKSIFEGDRGHLHHILLDSGLAKWKVLLIFISISSLACAVGFLCIIFEVKEYLRTIYGLPVKKVMTDNFYGGYRRIQGKRAMFHVSRPNYKRAVVTFEKGAVVYKPSE